MHLGPVTRKELRDAYQFYNFNVRTRRVRGADGVLVGSKVAKSGCKRRRSRSSSDEGSISEVGTANTVEYASSDCDINLEGDASEVSVCL